MTSNIDPFAPITGKEMGIVGMDDWIYRDIPWTTKENWEKLLEIIQPNNHHILVFTIRDKSIRGQALIAPKGFENIKAFF